MKNKLLTCLLLLSMMLAQNSIVFAQDVERDSKGNYILTEEAFTELWIEYTRRGLDLETERKYNKTLEEKMLQMQQSIDAADKRAEEERIKRERVQLALVAVLLLAGGYIAADQIFNF